MVASFGGCCLAREVRAAAALVSGCRGRQSVEHNGGGANRTHVVHVKKSSAAALT